jgi:uncharacterized membrane protein
MQTTTGATAGRHPFAWLREAPDCAALVVIALAGLAISIYLTIVHYAHVSLVCPASGSHINCTAVTTSVYSVVHGTQVPITVPGLLWFLVSGILAGVAWMAQVRTGVAPTRIVVAHAIWGAVGLVTVLYLVYVEVVLLHYTFCEWCTGVHVLTLLTFLIALYRVQQLPGPEQDSDEAAG